MHIVSYEKRYAEKIATLLNTFLPFEEETEQTIDSARGIRFLCVHEDEVIGYIAGYPITAFEKDFPYYRDQLQKIQTIVSQGVTYYSSHFVVNPKYRKLGIGTKLVDAYLKQVKSEAHAIVVVGWVQSDTNRWAAKKQFIKYGFEPIVYINRYFEPYNVYCPSCKGMCYCDADIYAHLF